MPLAERICGAADARERGRAGAYDQRASHLAEHARSVEESASIKAYNGGRVASLSLPNGCIRLYGGLFELFDDEELIYLAGVQAAHVKLGHEKRRLSTAWGDMASLGAPQNIAGRTDGLEAVLEKTAYTPEEEISADAEALQAGPGSMTVAARRALEKMSSLRTPQPSLFSGATLASRLAAIPAAAGPGVEQQRQQGQTVQQAPRISALQETGAPVGQQASAAAAPPAAESHSVPDAHLDLGEEFSAWPGQAAGHQAAPAGALVKTASLSAKRPAERFENPPLQRPVVRPAAQAAVPAPGLRSAPGKWYVQAAAARTELDALSRSNILRSLSYKVLMQKVDIEGQTYYRVLAGPFSSREEAAAKVDGIKESGATEGAPFIRELK